MASSMKRWFPAVTLLVVATILVAQTLSPAQDSTLPTIPDRQSPSSFVSEPPSIYEQKPIEATGLVGENVRHPSAPDFAPATPYASPQGRSNAPVVNGYGFPTPIYAPSPATRRPSPSLTPTPYSANCETCENCAVCAIFQTSNGVTWERKVGPFSSILTIEQDLLSGILTCPEFSVEFMAECSTTSDSVLYGVLQSVTLQSMPQAKNDDIAAIIELEALSNAFIDVPFSARIRQDGDRLVLKDVKIAGLSLGTKDEELVTLLRTVVVGNYRVVNRTTTTTPRIRSHGVTY